MNLLFILNFLVNRVSTYLKVSAKLFENSLVGKLYFILYDSLIKLILCEF